MAVLLMCAGPGDQLDPGLLLQGVLWTGSSPGPMAEYWVGEAHPAMYKNVLIPECILVVDVFESDSGCLTLA